MKKALLSALTFGLLFGSASFCPAQIESKPLLCVSIASYDKLSGRLATFGQQSGTPTLDQQLELILAVMTQGRGLAGIDTKQPCGAAVMTNGPKPFAIIGFLPVTDMKQVIDVLKGDPSNIVKRKGDTYELQAMIGPPLYIKQVGNWAMMSNRTEDLVRAPADPLKVLGDLPKKYDLAIRLFAKDAPKEFREQLVAYARAAAEAGWPQAPGESNDDYESRVSALRQAVETLAPVIDQLEDVLLGWNLGPGPNPDANPTTSQLDLEVKAQPGTKLAERFARMKPGKTRLAGMLTPGVATSGNLCGAVADDDVAAVKRTLAAVREWLSKKLRDWKLPDPQAKFATALLSDMVEVAEKTVEAKKVDVTADAMVEAEMATFLVGATITGGDALEKQLVQLVDALKKEDAEAAKDIKLNAESYAGLRFHRFSVPIDHPRLEPFIGKTLEVVLAVSDDRVILAAGRDAAATLKKVLDGSKNDGDVLPMQVSMTALPIAKFLARLALEGHGKAWVDAMAENLQTSGGKDHLILTTQPMPQGVWLRLKVEEGVLKAVTPIALRSIMSWLF